MDVPSFRSNVIPITPHVIHIDHHHHDSCCVGSDRVSDSVAKKPISASSDSRMYQRCLQTPKLIIRRWMKLILPRWKNILVGISSVRNVLRKKSCTCVRSSSCTRSSSPASTT